MSCEYKCDECKEVIVGANYTLCASIADSTSDDIEEYELDLCEKCIEGKKKALDLL